MTTSSAPAALAVERMTSLDAAFLYAESDRTPMHIGSVSVFEGTPFFDDTGTFRLEAVQARVAERLHLFPRFRKRLAFVPFDLGRPFWVDDIDFDIAEHVRLLVLPSPGSVDELEALAARVHMRTLDRRRPLWELLFVGGLAHGRIGLIQKLHHAMVDGISGVDVAAALLDLVPSPPIVDVPVWHPVPPPDIAHLVVEGLREDLAQPIDLARDALQMLWSPRETAARVVGALGMVNTAVRNLPGIRPAPLRQQVGGTRLLRSVSVSLDDVRQAAHRREASINDVALTAVAAGVGHLLRSRGEATEDASLQVMVPVSLRADDEHLALGNRVSALFVQLPLRPGASDDRLAAVRAEMHRVKDEQQSQGAELLLHGVDAVPVGLLSLLSRAIHHQGVADLVVTNVPGPPFPLYFLGAELLTSTPIVPLGGNLSVNIALMSYNGGLTFGIHADADTCPDVGLLVEGIERELATLCCP